MASEDIAENYFGSRFGAGRFTEIMLKAGAKLVSLIIAMPLKPILKIILQKVIFFISRRFI